MSKDMKERSTAARMEFRYRARMPSREERMQDAKPDIATKAELNKLKADQRRAAPAPKLEPPKPKGMVSAPDAAARQEKMRARRMRHIENRLGAAKQSMARGWERTR